MEFDAVVITPEIATTYVIKYTSEAGTQEIPTPNVDVFIPAPNPIANSYNVTVAYKTTKMSMYSSAIYSSMLIRLLLSPRGLHTSVFQKFGALVP